MERLQKIIANSGLTSRRAAEELIIAGKVRLNGRIITELGTQADPEKDEITVSGKPLPKARRIVYAVNKPKGVVCTRIAQDDSSIITDLVPKAPAVYPIGRLDKESEGLILLSNDGDLTAKLTHPKHGIAKTYVVSAKPRKEFEIVSLTKLVEKFTTGIKLSDGKLVATGVSIKPLPDMLQITMTIHEGRKHVIRRACTVAGLQVKRLVRTQIGRITLTGIQSGKYRILTAEEIARLA